MMESNAALMSVAYLAPVQYYSKFLIYENIFIEKHENYSKQSYRNRCVISAANGPETLSIPVERTDSHKCPITDVKIEYCTAWQKIHLKAIESAYRNAPFYQYYIDDLVAVYEKKCKFLFDFNIALQQVVLQNIQLQTKIFFTEEYFNSVPESISDFRESIHPKPRCNKPDNDFVIKNYPQVFDLKFGFIPNLSIIDLLLNCGPDSKEML